LEAIVSIAGGDRWRRNNMKKLFISQPMRGKTNEEIMLVREKAIKSTERELGERVEVIDSFFKDAPHDAQPLWYLGESLKLLSTADVAYFAKGWGGARGCRIEHQCAIDYEIELVIEEPKPVVTEKARSEFDLLTDAVSGKDAESIRKAIDLVMQSGLAFDCLNVALNSRSASIEIHFSERAN
jgi:hypothetical protein